MFSRLGFPARESERETITKNEILETEYPDFPDWGGILQGILRDCHQVELPEMSHTKHGVNC